MTFPQGNHLIRLHVVDDHDRFSDVSLAIIIQTKESHKEENVPVPTDALSGAFVPSVRISRANPNPYGNDSIEWFELENTSSTNASLNGCGVRTHTKKTFLFPANTHIPAKSSKKWYPASTHISLENSSETLEFFCQNVTISKLDWGYPVPENYIISADIDPKNRVTGIVERVIDGDTIEVRTGSGTQKVRLIGVDTPEIHDENPKLAELAKLAANYTRGRLQSATVSLEFDIDQQDIYGRTLAYVWLQDENFNETIIKNGYGRVYLPFSFRYSKLFEKANSQAKKQKLGIWNDPEVTSLLSAKMRQEKSEHTSKMHTEQIQEQKFLSDQLASEEGNFPIQAITSISARQNRD